MPPINDCKRRCGSNRAQAVLFLLLTTEITIAEVFATIPQRVHVIACFPFIVVNPASQLVGM